MEDPGGKGTEKGEVNVGGNEASQGNSRLRSDVEDVAERGPSREGNSNDVKGEEVGPVGVSSTVLAATP